MGNKLHILFVFFSLTVLVHSGLEAQMSMRDSLKNAVRDLTSLQEQIVAIDEKITTYTDYEVYSRDYRDFCMQADYYFEGHQPFIMSQKEKLFPLWSQIVDRREALDEKISNLEQENQRQMMLNDLNNEFGSVRMQYEQLLQGFQKIPSMKRNPSADTLALLKKKDSELYPTFSAKKSQQEVKDLIVQNPSLDSTCNFIEAAHKAISEAKDIEKIKWGDIIFKVTLVTAVLFFLINLIVSKKKLKNQLNGKKNKYTPSI